jgi:hypothetical protein
LSKRRNDQERRMKNEERLMKKLGIRRPYATSSHLVKITKNVQKRAKNAKSR